MESATKLVEVTDELANKIAILRLNEVGLEQGGFERNLDSDRVSNLVNTLKLNPKIVIPPIVLAYTDGQYIMVDGQHRLEARKKIKYPLYAQVTNMTQDQAIENFCLLNGKSVRVSLQHRLKIDPSKVFKRIRETALRFKLPNNYVYHMLAAALGERQLNTSRAVQEHDWELVEFVLKDWSKDYRWKSNAQFYNKPAVLVCLVKLCKKNKQPAKILKSLKKINYDPRGPIATRYGLTFNRLRDMMNFFNDYLIATL